MVPDWRYLTCEAEKSSKKIAPLSEHSHLAIQTYPTKTSCEWKVYLHVISALDISPFITSRPCTWQLWDGFPAYPVVFTCIFTLLFSHNTPPDSVFPLFSLQRFIQQVSNNLHFSTNIILLFHLLTSILLHTSWCFFINHISLNYFFPVRSLFSFFSFNVFLNVNLYPFLKSYLEFPHTFFSKRFEFLKWYHWSS